MRLSGSWIIRVIVRERGTTTFSVTNPAGFIPAYLRMLWFFRSTLSPTCLPRGTPPGAVASPCNKCRSLPDLLSRFIPYSDITPRGGDAVPTLSYEILRKDALGTPIWLEAAPNFEAAKARASELAARAPGEYVIFHSPTSKIVANLRLTPTLSVS